MERVLYVIGSKQVPKTAPYAGVLWVHRYLYNSKEAATIDLESHVWDGPLDTPGKIVDKLVMDGYKHIQIVPANIKDWERAKKEREEHFEGTIKEESAHL